MKKQTENLAQKKVARLLANIDNALSRLDQIEVEA